MQEKQKKSLDIKNRTRDLPVTNRPLMANYLAILL